MSARKILFALAATGISAVSGKLHNNVSMSPFGQALS
jgi:hypothetical protein